MQVVDVPTQLPEGWRASSDPRGVVIDAIDAEGRMLGSVTVCEQVRGFTPGVCTVYPKRGAKKYAGRGWKQQLYSDAVASLQAVFARRDAQQQSIC